jgi:hypothetical protein
MTATLKSKQTSIATVRYHLLPVASLLTPLIFHYPLPLRMTNRIKAEAGRGKAKRQDQKNKRRKNTRRARKRKRKDRKMKRIQKETGRK